MTTRTHRRRAALPPVLTEGQPHARPLVSECTPCRLRAAEQRPATAGTDSQTHCTARWVSRALCPAQNADRKDPGRIPPHKTSAEADARRQASDAGSSEPVGSQGTSRWGGGLLHFDCDLELSVVS